ncbi:MAG: short-chain dehydrogenase [Subtercola sp.]|jgi:NAD(P)-dependent dehydrogenase (short-subunit alcohol dehydrogenase family)|nr:short-chain dehydrogenase [Subtercola sp.]
MLEGKSIVITGSGRGLGRATAIAAARAGANVVVNDVDGAEARSVAQQIIDEGGSAVASTHSVADPDQAKAIIDLCVGTFGRIDGLVNNAALVVNVSAWQTTAADIDRLVDVNVKGLFYCGVAALSAMHLQKSGVVLNITSRSHIGWPEASLYTATKGAVVSATYSWALDMAPFGVRVLALAPTAQTRMSGERTSDSDPADIAQVILYLLSDRASALSGQIVRFSGDKLSLLSRPTYDDPAVVREHFTPEQIADALENDLAAQRVLIGVGSADLSTIG